MNNKPKLLDLFCGAGGAGMGYHRAGFEVTGVDINPQPRYPFTFHQADALEYLTEHGNEYDVIHASPPCQRFSAITQNTGAWEKHPDLIAPTRKSLGECKKPYIIENVPGAPLIHPIILCGSSFGLRVRRHRCFESNITLFSIPCNHRWQDQSPIYPIYEHGQWTTSGVVRVYGRGGGKADKHWGQAMGIDWMTRKELTQSIPPDYTEHLGRQLMMFLGMR